VLHRRLNGPFLFHSRYISRHFVVDVISRLPVWNVKNRRYLASCTLQFGSNLTKIIFQRYFIDIYIIKKNLSTFTIVEIEDSVSMYLEIKDSVSMYFKPFNQNFPIDFLEINILVMNKDTDYIWHFERNYASLFVFFLY
jgi:hypothetical protein